MNARRLIAVVAMSVLPAALLTVLAARGQDADKRVLEMEAKRIAVIDKVKPSVVAIFARGGQGGGSGVLVSKEGFALTNFHVVQGSGPVMKCGLADGVLYDAVLVGLDKVGDVALIKLLPKEKGKDFPVSVMGDSDKVKAGDWSLAMGNPFLLATDFNPTVTFGLISGVNRYQYPAGTLLEYTDCIQIDTSINPGNSGGPLYNMDGELIGINGRGSFEKRGRVNSGVGYAISINQIKNFMGHMMAGIDTDHATLGAVVESEAEEGTSNRMVVKAVLDDADVRRRGLDSGDEVVSFAGRPTTSVNQYKNVLGLYPKGWRVPLVYRRDNAKHEILARLMQLQKQQNPDEAKPQRPQRPTPIDTSSPAAKLYEPKPGFSNFYFNKIERDRLLADFRKHGDFAALTGEWTLQADAEAKQKKSEVKVVIGEQEDKDKEGKPIVRQWTYHLNADALPALPEMGEKEEELRQAVRKAAGLLRKHAVSFPQEIFAKETEAQTKEYVAGLHKEATANLKALTDGLEELKKAGPNRGKEESRLWQAHYDYWLGRLNAYAGYATEYHFLLGQLAGANPPARDPKQHRGWRMVPDDKIQSGADATRLNGEAGTVWQKMIKDYDDTIWADRAKDNTKIKIGLRWQPSGGSRTLVRLKMGTDFELDPLKVGQETVALKDPPGSGGLMEALYQYRRFLTQGPAGFEGQFSHGGHEPIYPYPADGAKPKSFKDIRVDTEVIHTEHAAVPVKWYFSLKDHTLLAFEVFIDKDEDPCEVYLSDYRKVDGRLLPHRLDVRNGNNAFGTFVIKSYQLAAAK